MLSWPVNQKNHAKTNGHLHDGGRAKTGSRDEWRQRSSRDGCRVRATSRSQCAPVPRYERRDTLRLANRTATEDHPESTTPPEPAAARAIAAMADTEGWNGGDSLKKRSRVSESFWTLWFSDRRLSLGSWAESDRHIPAGHPE